MWNVKKVHRLDTGYTIWPWLLTSLMSHDLDLGFFKVKFRNSCISGIVGLIDVKWKGSELIRIWAECMTLPFDHTHDLDLEVSRSSVWISLISGMGRPIDLERKGCESSIHDNDIDFSVTMVWWVDVPDSDQGNFRCLCAIDISNLKIGHPWMRS